MTSSTPFSMNLSEAAKEQSEELNVGEKEKVNQRSEKLFIKHCTQVWQRTDRMFGGLMILQWLAGIGLAVWITPLTWIGATSYVHFHVMAAIILGGILAAYPLLLIALRPGQAITRYTIAVSQMLSSALLIHLSGGRIETHFHVFVSMAFLAFYRDWRVLVIATVVVAVDHYLRGVYWPQSVFGIAEIEPFRWMEHAGWVVLEDIFLWIMCHQSMLEMREIARRQAELELTNDIIEAQVRDRTSELKEKNKEIIDSIYYAERIQKSVLESGQRIHYPGVNLFFIYRPRDIVSGDFIWTAEHGDIVFVAAVDCTGHGVPGAFMSLLGHNFLDHIVGYEKITEPHLILSLLHEKIRTRLNQTNAAGTNRDGMDVCLCALETKTGILSFSGAKRPLYYTNASGELEICKGDHYSIGGIQREEKRVFTTQQIRLEPGQTFFLTTDGYVDQPSPENKKLGSQTLKILLKEFAGVPFTEKKRRLEEALDRYQNNAPQRDDITLIGMEWSPDQ